MMRSRQVQCPDCGAILTVPPGYSNCFVRCGVCHHRFRLPEIISLTDQAVADWLIQEQQHEQMVDHPSDEAQTAAKRALREAARSNKTQVLPAVGKQLRLRRIDSRGAVFEFPANRLEEAEFRCAMPRCCLRCGTNKHLVAHMIVYAPALADSFSLEAEHAAGQLAVSGEELEGLSGEQLLNKLPRVPNVPPPGNLPMPYWLCDGCHGGGLISGQIRVNPAGGKGLCRLFIRNLRLAAQFALAAGGADEAALAQLRRHEQVSAANPWEALSEAVQHRLQGWYHPRGGERFLAYIPDRDRARSEEGLYGIVVTNQRMILNTKVHKHEAVRSDSLEFSLAMAAGKGCLRVKGSDWNVQHFAVDRDGLARLRRALAKAEFAASWC